MKINYEIYKEGVDAYERGEQMDSNPYGDDVQEHLDWYHGWSDAQEAAYYNGRSGLERN